LLEASQAKGLSPANWIAAQLPSGAERPQPSDDFPDDLMGVIDSGAYKQTASDLGEDSKPLSELLSGLTGTIKSKADPIHVYSKTAFGEGVAAKLAKQGIHLP
jgi:hypothetical protein